MDILCVSDIHASLKALEALGKTISPGNPARPDLLLVAGDVSNPGQSRFTETFLELAAKAGVKAFCVGGNMDESHSWRLLEEENVSIHAKKQAFGGFEFVGFGGAPKGPFGTPSEYEDEELHQTLANLVSKKTILVSHAPPFNTKADVASSGMHVGCKSLRRLIEEKQPLACVSGHIHESQAVDRIGNTPVVNCGAAKEGKAARLELPSGKIELVKLF